MATIKSDELNIVQDQIVEKRNILPIDQFFDEMYLTESEKAERKDLAKAIFVILTAILTIIKASEVLKNPHDIEYYKGYVDDNLRSLFSSTFIDADYSDEVKGFAESFIEATMRNIDKEYFTSEDRATVNAENTTNSVYNRHQLDEAIRIGKTSKKWVTMHDQRVRKTHEAADGQEVAIDKPFEVGGYQMMYPLDKSLGAHSKECINCRCVVIYSGDSSEEPEVATIEGAKEEENNVIEAPVINNKYVSDSRDNYEEHTLNSNGNPDMQTRLIQVTESTPVVEDLNNPSPFGYIPKNGIIVYNPSSPSFSRYDMTYGMTHEYAHVVDVTQLHSWESADYMASLEKAKISLYNNLALVGSWYGEGGIYEFDAATSDIISALSVGTLNNYVPYGHSTEYWNEVTKPLEIFANTTAIDMSEKDYSAFKTVFKDLFDAYGRLVQWKKS